MKNLRGLEEEHTQQIRPSRRTHRRPAGPTIPRGTQCERPDRKQCKDHTAPHPIPHILRKRVESTAAAKEHTEEVALYHQPPSKQHNRTTQRDPQVPPSPRRLPTRRCTMGGHHPTRSTERVAVNAPLGAINLFKHSRKPSKESKRRPCPAERTASTN